MGVTKLDLFQNLNKTRPPGSVFYKCRYTIRTARLFSNYRVSSVIRNTFNTRVLPHNIVTVVKWSWIRFTFQNNRVQVSLFQSVFRIVDRFKPRQNGENLFHHMRGGFFFFIANREIFLFSGARRTGAKHAVRFCRENLFYTKPAKPEMDFLWQIYRDVFALTWISRNPASGERSTAATRSCSIYCIQIKIEPLRACRARHCELPDPRWSLCALPLVDNDRQ